MNKSNFLIVVCSLISFLLTSCTTFQIPAKNQKEFKDLMLPRVQFEYGYYLKSAPYFEGESLVNLSYDEEGNMTSCKLQSKGFPEAFKLRLCEYVFGKIKYLHTGEGKLKITLIFKQKSEEE